MMKRPAKPGGSAGVAGERTRVIAATPFALFRIMFGISSVTIGGGYAIVPVIGQALQKRGWMSEADFFQTFAQAQSFPGPLALSTALIAGYRIAGPRGAAAAAAGVILPPFGAIIIVSAILERVGQNRLVRDFLAGASAAIPGLVAALVWKMAKSRRWTIIRLVSTALLSLSLAFFSRLTLPLFLGAVIVLFCVERRWNT